MAIESVEVMYNSLSKAKIVRSYYYAALVGDVWANGDGSWSSSGHIVWRNCSVIVYCVWRRLTVIAEIVQVLGLSLEGCQVYRRVPLDCLEYIKEVFTHCSVNRTI